jgi:hypothetical protein
MPVIYEVTITLSGIENYYTIYWFNPDTNTRDSFDTKAELTPEETGRLWQKLPQQLPIGQKLFRFLDGDARHFKRALDHAFKQAEPLQIHLRTCPETDDWPFELLADDNAFLLPSRVHLVRYVSEWGKEKETSPADRELNLLFMACSALDVPPELDFEGEEEAIFQVTENLPIDMEVEDSGTLEGLRAKLVQERYDVVHLSGHADIDEKGQPYFIMEDETGNEHRVFPDMLWGDALIENSPRLLFLSGCRTGEAPCTPGKAGTSAFGTSGTASSTAAMSFARLLVEKYHVPAVLGWGRPVADDQAGEVSRVLYHELSRGKSILDAVQRARYELLEKLPLEPNPGWPLLRLYSSGIPLIPVVTENQRQQPKPRRINQVFLANSRIQVLVEGFVGRRRQLQASLYGLKQDYYKVGLLLLGSSGLGKSCLAGKICERFNQHTLILLNGKLDSAALTHALTDAFVISQDEKGQQILSQKKEMTQKLANLCATSFKEKNYLLLLDDFEQNLETPAQGKPVLLPEAADLLKTLLYYLQFSGNMTQLIITSRYEFSLTKNEQDLVAERLEKIWLTSFLDTEQRKKARGLKNIVDYPNPSMISYLVSAGQGNPLLMEELDLLAGRLKEAETQQLIQAVKEKQEEFRKQHQLQEPLRCSRAPVTLFLRWASIYRRPVLEEGLQRLAEKANLPDWQKLLPEAMGLGLVEYDQARRSYQVTPLLRHELTAALENPRAAHEVAFNYYRNLCEKRNAIDPLLTEEWIFHALGCGEEEVAAQQAAVLVDFFREHQALQKSRQLGEWVLSRKKSDAYSYFDTLSQSLEATLRLLSVK